MSDFDMIRAAINGVVMVWLLFLGVRAKSSDLWPRAHTPTKVTNEPVPLASHVGTYRTNPRPQPSLPRKTPWGRLALWWARGGQRRLERRRLRRWAEENAVTPKWLAKMRREAERRTISVEVADLRLEGARMRLYDHDGESALMEFRLPELPTAWPARVGRASAEVDCPTCCAVVGEPCCPNEH